MTLRSATEQLPLHSQPVNRAAAFQVSHAKDREELLCAQREAFNRALSDARIRNMHEDQQRRRELNRERLDPDKHENKLRSWAGIVAKREKMISDVQAGKDVSKYGHQGNVWATRHAHLGWRYPTNPRRGK